MVKNSQPEVRKNSFLFGKIDWRVNVFPSKGRFCLFLVGGCVLLSSDPESRGHLWPAPWDGQAENRCAGFSFCHFAPLILKFSKMTKCQGSLLWILTCLVTENWKGWCGVVKSLRPLESKGRYNLSLSSAFKTCNSKQASFHPDDYFVVCKNEIIADGMEFSLSWYCYPSHWKAGKTGPQRYLASPAHRSLDWGLNQSSLVAELVLVITMPSCPAHVIFLLDDVKINHMFLVIPCLGFLVP